MTVDEYTLAEKAILPIWFLDVFHNVDGKNPCFVLEILTHTCSTNNWIVITDTLQRSLTVVHMVLSVKSNSLVINILSTSARPIKLVNLIYAKRIINIIESGTLVALFGLFGQRTAHKLMSPNLAVLNE